MRVTSAELVISAAQAAQFPKEPLPQIAVCGRSNVGKSSLLNTLLQRKQLARTSSTPGKTRLINFFRITPAGTARAPFCFVDLPGYGYAKVSQAERESWRRLIESFFESSSRLVGAISIIDSRHGPMDSDLELLAWLAELELPVVLVATKADKLSNKARAEMSRQITAAVAHLPLKNVLFFSAHTGSGSNELWKAVTDLLQEH
jgi:GTP-binding protein